MAKYFVSNKDESVRMFKSDFLDSFSRIHWTVPLYIFLPVVLFFSIRSFVLFNIELPVFIGLFVCGVLSWSLTEYLLHRFIFHLEPSSDFGKKIHFTFHGVHHDYPQDSKRLVMVPSVSVPLALIFYILFHYTMGEAYTSPFFSGFVLGYLLYDMTHYAVHHFAFKNGLFLKLKTHHMKHHYTNPDLGFGVSSPLWDYVFRTTYPEKKLQEGMQ